MKIHSVFAGVLLLVVACQGNEAASTETPEEELSEHLTLSSYDFVQGYIAGKEDFLEQYKGKMLTIEQCLVETGFSNLSGISLVGFNGHEVISFVSQKDGRYAEFEGRSLPNYTGPCAWIKLENATSTESVDLQASSLAFDQERPGHDGKVNITTFHTMVSIDIPGDSLFMQSDQILIARGAKVHHYQTYTSH